MPAPGLYIMSTAPYAGKNAICAGLEAKFRQNGFNAGYFRPVGNFAIEKDGNACDEEAVFMLEALGIGDRPDMVCPVLATQDFKMGVLTGDSCCRPEDLPRTVKNFYDELNAKHDLMLIRGGDNFMANLYCRLDDVSLAHALGPEIKVAAIDRIEREVNYDALLHLKNTLGDKLAGVILNMVHPGFMSEVDTLARPFLKRNGIPLLGVIPHDRLLGSVRAFYLAESLGGKIISASGRNDRMVENFLIGTMQAENFVSYFRRAPKAAVIVGGDRADIQLIAIEGDCSCLVLTGNILPNELLLARAEARNVPVIMVREDTYATAGKVEAILKRGRLRDKAKLPRCAELASEHIDFAALRACLGL